jgi:hypothetical protein
VASIYSHRAPRGDGSALLGASLGNWLRLGLGEEADGIGPRVKAHDERTDVPDPPIDAEEAECGRYG